MPPTSENTPPLHSGAEVVNHGTHRGLTWWVVERELVHTKYLCGYVSTPLPLDDCDFLDVHGGITYDTGNIVGFDTLHSHSNPTHWTVEVAIEETIKLGDQIAAEIERNYPRQQI